MGTDLRVAVRSLVKRPAHSLISVLTLTVVVAAATVIFSVLEGVLLRPLPYPNGDRLYRVFHTDLDGSADRDPVTRDALRVWSEDAESVEEIGGYVRMSGPWGDELNTDGAFVLQGFFEVLGAEPLIGRLPTRAEVRSSANLLVLSEDLWTTMFGRDPNVLGRTVRYTWTSGTVVGVLPGTFAFPSENTGWWSPVPENFADRRTDVPQISASGPDRERGRTGAGDRGASHHPGGPGVRESRLRRARCAAGPASGRGGGGCQDLPTQGRAGRPLRPGRQ